MNKVYRILWNTATQSWSVTSELARGRRKNGTNKKILAAVILAGSGSMGSISAIAAPANSFAVGILATSSAEASCLSSTTPGAISTSGSVCDAGGGGKQAALISYDDKGGWGSYIVAPNPDSIHLGAGGKSALKITKDGIFANNNLDMASKKIASLAVGTADTDAVNVSQLKGIATALGGGAAVNADGSIKAPNYVIQGTGYTNVGDAFTKLDGTTTNNTTNITDLDAKVSSITGGTTGLVQQDATSKAITVAKDTGGTTVSLAGTAGARQLKGMSSGTADTDAVNVSQLKGIATALGGGAAVNADGSIKAPNYVIQGTGYTNVGDAFTRLDGATTNNTTNITNLDAKVSSITSGTTGLVQQDATSKAITVAKDTDGTTVSLTGTAGARQLKGMSSGTADTDAVNVSQLKGIATALGGGAAVNADGSIKAPSYTIQGTSYTNVGDAFTRLDGATTTNTTNITNLDSKVSSITGGTTGLVQQDGTSKIITIAKDTDGVTVSLNGTSGTRQIKDMSKGTADTDAVNVSQLKGVATALGGGAAVNADGSIKAPSYTIQGTSYTNVGDAFTRLDGATTTNTTNITNLDAKVSSITSGTIGLVQQDPTSKTITVASATDGRLINLAGTTGPRVLSGIGNGTNDTDAVSIAQLKSVGLIDPSGKLMASVVYDDLTLGHVTLGGSYGTVIGNVADGLVAAGSKEAINGGQLFTLQQEMEKKFTALDADITNLGDKITNLGGDVTNLNTLVTNKLADASTSVKLSPGTGAGSIQIGPGATASGANSIAMGAEAKATGYNAVALGSGSVADRDNTISVGSAGNERQITNVAAGTAPTDAVNLGQLNGRFDSAQRAIDSVARHAYAGVAAAMAMPNMTPSGPGRTIIAAGAANYKSAAAAAAGITYRSLNNRWLINGAVSVTNTGSAAARTQMGYEF
ncbi:ESPR-type extended signal peptide-containing protein [Paraburkholderia bonniea]|uniref:ESPR-type extended signal peptide-containing protein n=1 Tax=Paraburkholderia bonniea TaxID=2152891 RepID=UPI0012922210|nr:ESPR-type extended signal peptide-containing protein [Paraburkholderia bonniea]WJF90753.1 ESPR-type extended signal peptide-containing protein [Paraburkholderia bonniea]WJF94067.1 ESPR-type extended signal peptide-containing protein [Paraburkholderia bonniea]